MNNTSTKTTQSFSEEHSLKKSHNNHVLLWVLAILVILGIILFIGLRSQDTQQELSPEEYREQRQEALDQQTPYRQIEVGTEARNEQINNFFNN
jgi:uncharacterized protein HemX